jgi:hypothetical protein
MSTPFPRRFAFKYCNRCTFLHCVLILYVRLYIFLQTSCPFAIDICKCLLADNCFYVLSLVADFSQGIQAPYDVVLFEHRLYAQILNTCMFGKAK